MPDFKANWLEPLHDDKDRTLFPAMALWTQTLRIPQLIIAFIMLVMEAFAASQLGTTDAMAFTFFLFVWTVLFLGWFVFSAVYRPEYYHPLIHLPLETLTNIFWLTCWALFTSEAAKVNAIYPFNPVYSTSYTNALNCITAGAAIGALEWLLFCITLFYLIVAFVENRKRAPGDPEVGSKFNMREYPTNPAPEDGSAPVATPAVP